MGETLHRAENSRVWGGFATGCGGGRHRTDPALQEPSIANAVRSKLLRSQGSSPRAIASLLQVDFPPLHRRNLPRLSGSPGPAVFGLSLYLKSLLPLRCSSPRKAFLPQAHTLFFLHVSQARDQVGKRESSCVRRA